MGNTYTRTGNFKTRPNLSLPHNISSNTRRPENIGSGRVSVTHWIWLFRRLLYYCFRLFQSAFSDSKKEIEMNRSCHSAKGKRSFQHFQLRGFVKHRIMRIALTICAVFVCKFHSQQKPVRHPVNKTQSFQTCSLSVTLISIIRNQEPLPLKNSH